MEHDFTVNMDEFLPLRDVVFNINTYRKENFVSTQ